MLVENQIASSFHWRLAESEIPKSLGHKKIENFARGGWESGEPGHFESARSPPRGIAAFSIDCEENGTKQDQAVQTSDFWLWKFDSQSVASDVGTCQACLFDESKMV
jgi:hypothetical protein